MYGLLKFKKKIAIYSLYSFVFLFCCFIRFPVYFLKKWASLVKKKKNMAATKTRFNPQSAIGHRVFPARNLPFREVELFGVLCERHCRTRRKPLSTPLRKVKKTERGEFGDNYRSNDCRFSFK